MSLRGASALNIANSILYSAALQVRFPMGVIDGLGLFYFLERVSREKLRRLDAVSVARASCRGQGQLLLNGCGLFHFPLFSRKVHTQVVSGEDSCIGGQGGLQCTDQGALRRNAA